MAAALVLRIPDGLLLKALPRSPQVGPRLRTYHGGVDIMVTCSKSAHRLTSGNLTLGGLVAAVALTANPLAQEPSRLPTERTAVSLPSVSEKITGPGRMFDSTPSLPPGKGLSAFGYEVTEYFVTGTANGQPYKTRLVVRRPADDARFSGLVLAEAMHFSGAAHMFEFTSTYTMSSGHAAVEILVTSPAQFKAENQARYADLQVAAGQANEILAQVGALVRTGRTLGGARVRKMVLAGTSMSAGVVINYLPAQAVYRTPGMERIYDGFLPTSVGLNTPPNVDVPIIEMPTMLEVSSGGITDREDGDEPGQQYRLYEFAGMAHIDTRDSVRMKPNPCSQPLSEFPHQAYVAVGLNHLLQWVDRGVVPPRAPRIQFDRGAAAGPGMVLDAYGNPRGGIRNPYVDVPIARYGLRPPAISPVIPNPSAYIAAGGQGAANLMCGLSGTEVPLPASTLRELYQTRADYVAKVDKRVNELEKEGWSLNVYRDLILADAARVSF